MIQFRRDCMDNLSILARSAFSFIYLLILSKMTGKRQISQMTFYDYTTAVTIGSIAAVMAVEDDISVWYSVIAMAAYALLTLLVAFLTDKSILLRRFFTGTPSVLIANGKIIRANMKKNRIDINDLLTMARGQGYFDINQIRYAVFETTGSVSFMPRDDARPATVSELSLAPQESPIFSNVVIDGKVLEKNLRAIGKDEKWLENTLKNQNLPSAENMILITASRDGEIHAYQKNGGLPDENFFL